jgi:hypothetical protein
MVFLVLLVASARFQAGAEQPREEDEAAPARSVKAGTDNTSEPIALMYSLQFRDGEQWKTYRKEELAEQEFAIGRFFRLVVDPKLDCYLYVINRGAGGNAQIIFPPTGRDMHVKAESGERVIPDPDPVDQRDRYFEFGPPAGNERLYVVATVEKVQGRDAFARKVIEQYAKPDRPVDAKVSQSVKAALLRFRGVDSAATGAAARVAGEFRVYLDDLSLTTRTADE